VEEERGTLWLLPYGERILPLLASHPGLRVGLLESLYAPGTHIQPAFTSFRQAPMDISLIAFLCFFKNGVG
jgi:hypothetical protein